MSSVQNALPKCCFQSAEEVEKKITHKLTCEFCTRRNSIAEQYFSAASCLLNHIQKTGSSSVYEWKLNNSPSFLLKLNYCCCAGSVRINTINRRVNHDGSLMLWVLLPWPRPMRALRDYRLTEGLWKPHLTFAVADDSPPLCWHKACKHRQPY